MGDSMNQARAFMRNCQTALFDMAASDLSMSGFTETGSACLNTDICVAALTSVQTGAKLNHALAIYRAAQQALNAIESPQLLSERIERLSYLISQYQTGLLELEALQKEDTQETDITPKHDNFEVPLNSANDTIYYYSPEARQAQATRALNDTVKLAKITERPALETLLAFSENTGAQGSDIGTSEDNASSAQNEPSMTVEPKTPKVHLDSMVQDIVQLGLTVARQHGLTLSLSYDMGDKTIAEDKAERLKMRSCQWLTYLIRHIAASHTVDALAESMAHIDISASEREMSFSTIAPDLPVTFSTSEIGMKAIRPTYEARTNRLTLNMPYEETPSEMTTSAQGESSKNIPKMPVDEGINARLEALLAGNTHLIAFEPKRATS